MKLICSFCKEEKLEEEFYRTKTRPTGRNAWCKSCQKAYTVKWHKQNKKKNPDKIKQQRKDRIKNNWKGYKATALVSTWKRMAKYRELPISLVPSIDETRLWLEQNKPYKCYYTGEIVTEKTMGIDHKQPLSRGGDFSFNNLAITTKTINKAKGALTEKEFKEILNVISSWEDKGKLLLARLRIAGMIYNRGT